MKYRDHDEVDEWEFFDPDEIDELDDFDDEEDGDEDESLDDDDSDFDEDDSEVDEDEEEELEAADDYDDAEEDSEDEDGDEEPLPEKPAPKVSARALRKQWKEELSAERRGLHILSDEQAEDCEDSLGYRFKDRRKLEHGLMHSSIARTRLDSNERLEFLGDSIMGAVICETLYNQYPDLPEGEMTRIKSAVVSRQTCAKIAKEVKLHRYLLLGKGFPSRDRVPDSIIGSCFEAIVASVYLDGGYDAARAFVLRTMNDEVKRTARSAHAENYKSHLQQMSQKHYGHTPNYRVVDEKGPDHSKCFEIAVTIGSRIYPSAWGPSKKEAEQNAARAAIEIIAKEKNEKFE